VFPGISGFLEVFGDEAVLIALVGPAGSGKTTFRRHWLPEVDTVHLDENRAVVSPFRCEADQAVTAAAVQMAFTQAASLLTRGRHVLWDATNAERADRMALQVLAAEHETKTAAIVLLPELELCLARNDVRDATACPCGFTRRVPDAVVARMHADITRDLRGLSGEGWDVVAVADHETGTYAGVAGRR
jgi:predicted kinase